MNDKLENNLKTFDQDQEGEPRGSVFDFFYADHARISTFLSQFNDFGNLTNIIHGKSAERGKADNHSINAQGNAVVLKASSNSTASTNAGYSESNQKSFDPRWVNTLNFLDQIEEKNLLNRDITKARFGDIVLIKGPILVPDFASLEKLWALPSFQTIAGISSSPEPSKNRQQRRKSERSGTSRPAAAPTDMDLFFDLVKTLPHRTQLRIGSGPSAWGILKTDGLTAASTDFALKFGGSIPGEWVAIGILDAVPDQILEPDESLDIDQLDQVSMYMLSTIEPLVRQFLGRPTKSYGITPLVVFREVGKSSA